MISNTDTDSDTEKWGLVLYVYWQTTCQMHAYSFVSFEVHVIIKGDDLFIASAIQNLFKS